MDPRIRVACAFPRFASHKGVNKCHAPATLLNCSPRAWLTCGDMLAWCAEKEKAATEILRYVYYWYNFMPLARGSAAVGYTTLLSLFWAFGMPISARIPRDYQTDWEAILCPVRSSWKMSLPFAGSKLMFLPGLGMKCKGCLCTCTCTVVCARFFDDEVQQKAPQHCYWHNHPDSVSFGAS
jgi:hypothetical protein